MDRERNKITYPRLCGRCHGKGEVKDKFGDKFGEGLCIRCLGTGYQNLIVPEDIECPHCNGTRLINGLPCVLCSAKGEISSYRRDSVAESEFREIFRISRQEGGI